LGVALRARVRSQGGRAESVSEHASAQPPDLVVAYEKHFQQLFAYCMAILRHRDDAEDAVQETFARAAAQHHKLEGELLPYLTTVARNISIDMIRQRRRRGPEIDAELPDRSRGPEPRAVDRYMLEKTWQMLSTRDRLLLAHSFAGFAYDEISRRTGLSPKSVSVGICRAREHSRTAATAVASLLIPAFVKRLLDRVRSAAANPQAASAALTGLEQGGVLVASVLVGLVGATSAGSVPAVPHHGLSPLAARSSIPAESVAAPVGASHSLAPAGAGPAPGGPTTPHSTVVPGGAGPDPVSTVLAPLPGHQASQQDTEVDSMTPSPQYNQDHTIFASGAVWRGCLTANSCPTVFRSQDGGATWTQLPAGGYSGGAVILPAAWPADPTLFVAGQAGLQRSDDHGTTFVTVVPYPAPAAVVPGLPANDTQVVVASSPLAVYLSAAHTVVPGPTLPAGMVADDVAFTDATHLLVTGHRSAPSLAGVVARCERTGSCSEVLDTPGEVLHVGTTPLASGQNLSVVWSVQHLYVSRDGGASFASAALPAGEQVSAASFGGGHLVVATYDYDASKALHSSLLASADGWAFQPMASSPVPSVVVGSLLPLADRMLAGLLAADAQQHLGMRCTVDLARSWQRACPA
jgi:RNA polymerase sigma factor (sigma-70 family)